MIDLSRVKSVLVEVDALVEGLHGLDLDERDAVTSQSKGDIRRRNAGLSQDLQLLATRLELAAALTRVEYWSARGEQDPLAGEEQ